MTSSSTASAEVMVGTDERDVEEWTWSRGVDKFQGSSSAETINVWNLEQASELTKELLSIAELEFLAYWRSIDTPRPGVLEQIELTAKSEVEIRIVTDIRPDPESAFVLTLERYPNVRLESLLSSEGRSPFPYHFTVVDSKYYHLRFKPTDDLCTGIASFGQPRKAACLARAFHDKIAPRSS